MLVAGPDAEPVVLDLFASAPTRDASRAGAELHAVEVSFGDASQVFHGGPASCAVYGVPAGLCDAVAKWGTARLEDLLEPAAALAGEGVALNDGQAYVAEILTGLLTSTPECAAIWAPDGRILREGQMIVNPELGDALRGSPPRPSRSTRRHRARGHGLARRQRGFDDAADLAGYEAIERAPVRMPYRDREILTNPPPSAGGICCLRARLLAAGRRRRRSAARQCDGGRAVRADT